MPTSLGDITSLWLGPNSFSPRPSEFASPPFSGFIPVSLVLKSGQRTARASRLEDGPAFVFSEALSIAECSGLGLDRPGFKLCALGSQSQSSLL